MTTLNTLCVTITWLSKTDLSNINSGEGGGGNVVELKTYRSGRRPYASGQSVRHALREAIERGNPGCFTSTPEAPSCDIKADWLCDLFGYLSPRKGEGSNRRWSPIKCTPALGQRDAEIVTDLLLRMSDLEKDEGKSSKDQRLAYVQLAENVFRTGLTVDAFAVGRRLVVEGSKESKQITRREFVDEIGDDERKRRIKSIVLALAQMGDFAKQARNAVSLAPDIFFGAVLPIYTQRGLRTMELDNLGNLETGVLATVAADLRELKGKMFVGHTPGVVGNDDALLEVCRRFDIPTGPPVQMLKKVAEEVQ
jgi:CRISPR-associated protein Cst2